VFCLPVNAADYGVPQIRHRVFVVAFRRDLGLADWRPPAPTYSSDALLADQRSGAYWDRHRVPFALRRDTQHPTALRTDTQRPTRDTEDGPAGRPPRVDAPGAVTGPPGATALGPGRDRERPLPLGTQSKAAPTDTPPQPWRTLRDAIADLPEPLGDRVEHPDWLHHYGWPGARVYRGHTPNELDRPAKTVKAGVHGVPGGESVLRRDDGSVRYLTVREVARIMTFPDDWWLAGPRGEQMRQLGNAVPVLLGEVMARAVHTALAFGGTPADRPA
jgi:DNA (cytosine-5)-methyltransferase 1